MAEICVQARNFAKRKGNKPTHVFATAVALGGGRREGEPAPVGKLNNVKTDWRFALFVATSKVAFTLQRRAACLSVNQFSRVTGFQYHCLLAAQRGKREAQSAKVRTAITIDRKSCALALRQFNTNVRNCIHCRVQKT